MFPGGSSGGNVIGLFPGIPQFTDANRPAPGSQGFSYLIYNTSSNLLQWDTGTAWLTIPASEQAIPEVLAFGLLVGDPVAPSWGRTGGLIDRESSGFADTIVRAAAVDTGGRFDGHPGFADTIVRIEAGEYDLTLLADADPDHVLATGLLEGNYLKQVGPAHGDGYRTLTVEIRSFFSAPVNGSAFGSLTLDEPIPADLSCIVMVYRI
jgi:hypothetical protein